MDFVTGLPWSEGCDAIRVVVDRFTKQRHLIGCRSDIDAAGTAELFLRHVFRLHGLPLDIVSDRGPQFVSDFWKHLCRRLGIERKLSTAFHPQTDGQTERLNAVMEQYLRSYVTYLQDDWLAWLPMAEFAANNHTSESTGVSPFFANLGYHPRHQFDLMPAPRDNVPDNRARALVDQLADLHDHLRVEMNRALKIQKEQANERRLPAPRYEPGDKVWLNAKNIKTRRPSIKLDHRRLGPYEVIESVTPRAIRLRLPETVRLHPVFHVSLLEPTADDPYPGQLQPPPPPVEVDGEEEWLVDDILDARIRYRKLQYLVKWTGYYQPTWEDATSVNGLQAVDNFHQAHPDKTGPLPEGN